MPFPQKKLTLSTKRCLLTSCRLLTLPHLAFKHREVTHQLLHTATGPSRELLGRGVIHRCRNGTTQLVSVPRQRTSLTQQRGDRFQGRRTRTVTVSHGVDSAPHHNRYTTAHSDWARSSTNAGQDLITPESLDTRQHPECHVGAGLAVGPHLRAGSVFTSWRSLVRRGRRGRVECRTQRAYRGSARAAPGYGWWLPCPVGPLLTTGMDIPRFHPDGSSGIDDKHRKQSLDTITTR